MNKHFEAFQKAISWFNYKNEPIEVFDIKQFNLTTKFQKTFPLTSELIKSSFKTGVEFKGKELVLFTWERNSIISGWLCQFDKSDVALIEEHQLLIDNIGGILHSFNGPEPFQKNGIDYNYSLTLNQDFMFIGSMNTDKLDWLDYYLDRCEELDCQPIDLSNTVFFTKEANGAKYFYDRESKDVKLFSHDHNFHFVDFLDGQPEYTMHRIKGVDSFTDYVEMLAEQWKCYLSI